MQDTRQASAGASSRPDPADGASAVAALTRWLGQHAPAGEAPSRALTTGLVGFLAGLWAGTGRGTLRHDAADPDWPDRDRFVVSDPALAPLHQALHALTGLAPASTDIAPARTDIALARPGQNVATAIGIALAERVEAARFGRSLVDHRTWVLASASELATGVVAEAAAIAGELGLDRLGIVFQTPGPPGSDAHIIDCADTDIARRFAASSWAVRHVDGNDAAAVAACLAAVDRGRKPTLVACHRSAPIATRTADPAGAAPDGPPYGTSARTRSTSIRRAWLKRLSGHPCRSAFETVHAPDAPHAATGARPATRLPPHAHATHSDGDTSTRDAVLAVAAREAEMSGASRVLHLSAGFTHVDLAAMPAIDPGQFGGRHLACHGRAQAVAMIAHGLARHGGILPVVLASLADVDAIRPALRHAACTASRLVVVLAEDAACPVDAIASLRAILGVWLFRPSTHAEASLCASLALARPDGPCVIAVSSATIPAGPRCGVSAGPQPGIPAGPRRGIPADIGASDIARGGYIAAEAATGRRAATLIATGPELLAALQARDMLAAGGIDIAVVSLPCWELFARQTTTHRATVLGNAPRFGVESAGRFGWERWLGLEGRFIGRSAEIGAADPGAPDGAGARPDLDAQAIADIVATARPRTARPAQTPGRQAWPVLCAVGR